MSSLRKHLRNFSKRALRKIFECGQHLGFDLLPRRFYSEIPVIHELRKSTHWRAPYSMMGISGADTRGQLDFVEECCPPNIVEKLTTLNLHADASQENDEVGFGPIEADFLYSLVATKKPAKIFQIGCGISTAVCLRAAAHAGYKPEVVCVEPYPSDYLVKQANQGEITLMQQRAQSLDMHVIDALDNDILFFVDSTHTLGPAGECSRIILEMLPRLKAGALVHFHDIMFPYDYSRDILDSKLYFWHESVLLQAFLSYNSRFRILTSLSMLHYSCPDALAKYLPNYQPAQNDEGLNKVSGHFPSSTYLEVMG